MYSSFQFDISVGTYPSSHFHHPKNFWGWPFCSQRSFSNCWQLLICFQHDFPFSRMSDKWLQAVVCEVWLPSLSKIDLRFIRVVTWINRSTIARSCGKCISNYIKNKNKNIKLIMKVAVPFCIFISNEWEFLLAFILASDWYP